MKPTSKQVRYAEAVLRRLRSMASGDPTRQALLQQAGAGRKSKTDADLVFKTDVLLGMENAWHEATK